ncbi:MAG: hypothetical protein JWL59_4329 [Chthoniobacteraceae bacterium]|nr:hypothetical protein [Chthoniobacteraceae bacterium]
MPRVSVGQVENLEETLTAVMRAKESLISSCERLDMRLTAKCEEIEREERSSSELLERATAIEVEAGKAVEAAAEQLQSARASLASANAALGACEAQSDDEDGNPPDCSSEESAVSEAEAEVEAAERALNEATERFEKVKEQRIRMEQRLELLRQAAHSIQQHRDAARSAYGARLGAVDSLADRAASRIASARNALEEYLAQNPSTGAFTSWVRWTPSANGVVTPAHLHERLNFSSGNLRLFVEYLADRDPGFRSKLSNYRKELTACRGPVETHAVQLKMRRNFAGEVAERFAIHALKPLAAEVVTQNRSDLPGGGFTKTDFILKNLKVPVVLGKGNGMAAGVGETIAGEIKCGKASYIFREKDHMVKQSYGHRDAAASITICSRDIKDLAPHEEEELRAALREAGSPLVGMLPRKGDLDQACWQAIRHLQESHPPRIDVYAEALS